MFKKVFYNLLNILYPLEKQIKRKLQNTLTVFTYHSISPEKSKPFNSIPYYDLRVTPQSFENHLLFLNEHFFFISEMDLTCGLENIKTDKPLGLITMDDGYSDNYHFAFPLLVKYNIPALIFLISNTFEKNYFLWDNKFLNVSFLTPMVKIKNFFINHIKSINMITNKEKLIINIMNFLKYEIKSQQQRVDLVNEFNDYCGANTDSYTRYLSIAQCKEIIKSGLVAFGSHTLSHCILTHSDEWKTEVRESKKYLEKNLNIKINSFCYPSGNYNPLIVNEIEKSNYSFAFTCDYGSNPIKHLSPYLVKRVHLADFSTNELIAEMSGFKQNFRNFIKRYI